MRQHNISYVTTGPNASRGHVNIRCPWCGADDPSQHLGVSLKGYGYSCWRNERHCGRSEAVLIQALLHCSLSEAEMLSGGQRELPADNDFGGELRRKLNVEDERLSTRKHKLELPCGFKSLLSKSIFAKQFRDYLVRERHYRDNQLAWLAEVYSLHYAIRGRFAYRIIIPFYDRVGQVVSWTGRSIVPDDPMRYLTLKHSESVCPPAETLLGLPMLWSCNNPRVLLVCEGPFDAMWMTLFGHSLGVYATCLFGLRMSEHQRILLEELRGRFPDTRLLLDSEARFQAFRMANSGTAMGVVRLPEEVKDPAELPPAATLDLCASLL